MPFIEMFVTEGALDEQSKRALHERVSRQVQEAEGAPYEGSELSRAITFMLIHEMPEGSWSVGSEVRTAEDEPRIVTRVGVPHGSMSDEKRRDIVARVNAEIVKVLGEEFTDPTKAFCLIAESVFSGGGQVVPFKSLMDVLGIADKLDGNENHPHESEMLTGNEPLVPVGAGSA
jgi:phenylpyruvate tautomerase PptA (4-oxalocrotonate tautomerase family)